MTRYRKQCPNCGGKRFAVFAHVTQEWLVDEYGICDQVINDFIDIDHEADDEDIWECYECGYEGAGEKFNVKEE